MGDIEKRIKKIEERLDRLDPPPRFASREEYVQWRDTHGGGMAAAMMIAAGRSALKEIKAGALVDRTQVLWGQVNAALRVEERLDRAKKGKHDNA